MWLVHCCTCSVVAVQLACFKSFNPWLPGHATTFLVLERGQGKAPGPDLNLGRLRDAAMRYLVSFRDHSRLVINLNLLKMPFMKCAGGGCGAEKWRCMSF